MKRIEPAAKPQVWPLTKIIPYPNNPRTHPDQQIELLATLMQKHGVDQPIVVDEEGFILKGHGRRLAAVKAGFEEFPVVIHRGLSDQDKRAIRLADNQVALLSGWNEALLRGELNDLSKAGYDMPLLGFDNMQLVTFMANVPTGGDPEATPEPPANPVSRAGDLWLLGKHRILCGDSTSEKDVERLLDEDEPKLMVADPPYGVSFERGKFVGREKAANGEVFAPIAGDDLRGKDLTDFISKVISAAFGNRDGVFYLWSASLHEGYSIYAGMTDAGIKVQSQLIWKKTPFVIGRADYHWQHEVCWYGFKGKNHPWYGGRDKGTVWDIPKPQKMEDHPTQKPVECMLRPIQNNSRPGEYVYDPFLGSGTTMIAAEMMNRYCLGLEISPAYVDVAIERWQAFAKAEAKLEDGRTYAEVARARKKAPAKKTEAVRKPGAKKGKPIRQAAE